MARITILVDNDAGSPDCGAEHGLSCFIELDSGPKWLWDTGRSELFLRNARTLHVDIFQAGGLALSHGHYDHTGGLQELLRRGFSAPIYAHPDVVLQRYAVKEGYAPRAIGLPLSMPPEELPRLHAVTETTELCAGLRMLCSIERLPGMCENVRNFYWDEEGTRPDTVRDDAALLLETKEKMVLVLGCCHSGLANTLYAIRDKTGCERIDTVLGGLHLGDAGPEETARQVDQAVSVLQEFHVRNIYAGHCTGGDARVLLAAKMHAEGNAVVRALGAGTCLDF